MNKECEQKILYLVVPCYNEEKVIEETIRRLNIKMSDLIGERIISDQSKIVFIDDGSKDNTWKLIKKYNLNNELIKGVKLSRNRGHQNALLAGLMTVKSDCDIVISLDADLQDDVEVIDKFVP